MKKQYAENAIHSPRVATNKVTVSTNWRAPDKKIVPYQQDKVNQHTILLKKILNLRRACDMVVLLNVYGSNNTEWHETVSENATN
ncbi:MAG: hypothetical protein E7320_03540 [Clostridiales bacterium]|nr:hypothetical protein [Clostridiales bacterium]